MRRRDELLDLIEHNRRKLHYLEVQRAWYGMATPPYIQMDIDFTIAAIGQLERELAQIAGPPLAAPGQPDDVQLVLVLLDRTSATPSDVAAQIARILNIPAARIDIQAEPGQQRSARIEMPAMDAQRLLDLFAAADAKLQPIDIRDLQALPDKPVARLPDPAGDLHYVGEDAMNKRVLLVDNAPNYLDATADYLEAAGYQVFRAVSLDRARKLLDYAWVHVAVIDLRMHDDDDPEDDSGLILAREPVYQVIPKIMLTRWPNYEAVRKALGPSLNGLPAAVDFVNKLDEIENMVQAIEQAFERHVRINFSLNITRDAQSSFPALVNLIESEDDNIRLLDRSAELEDLLRKLFHESRQITIGRVLRHSGSRIMLELFAYNEAGVERQYVVACGRHADIANENGRYRDLAPQATGKNGTIKALDAETLRFAATAYQLSGGDLEEIATFRDYYQGKPPAAVAACIDRLYRDTLAAWYRKGRTQPDRQPIGRLWLDTLGLRPEQLAPDTLGRQIAAIGRHLLAAGLVRQVECTDEQISLLFHNGQAWAGPHPAAVRYDECLDRQLPVLRGIVHGQIDADSILVDGQGQTWLIDFTRAGWGLLLQDYGGLETTIKLDLLDTLDLQMRYTLEQRLLAAASLTDELADDTLAPELQRALIAIQQIRHCAAALAGAQLDTYEVGLLCCALRYLTSYQPELQYSRRRLAPYAHALLQAALLSNRLIGTAPSPAPPATDLPEQARTSLWIDESEQIVWVEGTQIELTPQEYTILVFLYQQAGRLCTRQDIADYALGSNYDTSEESRLNSAISRLRLKLEPDPGHPKYLLTVRGRGYRLNVPGRA